MHDALLLYIWNKRLDKIVIVWSLNVVISSMKWGPATAQLIITWSRGRPDRTIWTPMAITLSFSGYGSTDLRLDTSTKLKMVTCWWYWHHHKKQNLYLNNIYKLYLTKVFFKPSCADILKILKKSYFVQKKAILKCCGCLRQKLLCQKL